MKFDKDLFERALKVRKQLRLSKLICEEAVSARSANTIRTFASNLQKKFPYIKEIMNKEFPELSMALKLANRSVFSGIFNIRCYCLECGVETTYEQNTLCPRCRYTHIGRQISIGRQTEPEALTKRRTARIKSTSLARYGVDNPMKSPEIKARLSATFAAHTEEDRAIARGRWLETARANHGNHVSCPFDIPKAKAKAIANMKLASKEGQRKKVETMVVRYGVTHQIHIKEVRDKVNTFKKRTVTIAGSSYTCQGYEHLAIEHLVARGYKVKTNLGGIAYVDALGIERKYYPDLAAVQGKRRLLIEVKSTYTFKWTRDNYPEKYLAGTAWASARGIDYVVLVMVPNKPIAYSFVNPKSVADLAPHKGQRTAIMRLPHL